MSKILSLAEASALFSSPRRIESLAEIVARMEPTARHEMFAMELESEELLYDWSFWARPNQIITDDPYYNVVLVCAGRGYGKTRTGSEWVRECANKKPGTRIGILGRTAAEVRDICVFGESGIMNIPQPESDKPMWKPSEAALYWSNGSYAKLFSSEKPDAVRGHQMHYFWCDELASYTPHVGPDGLTAYDNARLATRLGEKPVLLVTTTPKRVKVLRDMFAEAQERKTVKIIRGRTDENKSNLSSVYLDVIHGSFDGTTVARQELEGEMLDETPEGVLWTDDLIEHVTLSEHEAHKLPLRVVAVDPTVAKNPRDECGIVVVGATNERAMHKRIGYVLEDASLKGSPDEWAQTVVEMAQKWDAPVVVEQNQGHQLVVMALQNIDPTLRIFPVYAGVGKGLRAEPVAQIYEQGRVKHVAPGQPLLESQMTTWEPEHSKSSPDRMDALVHGVTALMLKEPKGMSRRPVRTMSVVGHRLPGGVGTGRSRVLTRGR